MDLTFISDTHTKHNLIDVGGGDILFHSGDATYRGHFNEIEEFLKWYSTRDYRHIVFTPGNHDFGFETDPRTYREMFKDAGVHLLIDETVVLDSIKIHGSPVTPWFHNWAFNRARNAAEASMYNIGYAHTHWDMMPDDTDVLLTHGPPYKILDELQYVNGDPKGQFVGCEDLLKRVKEVKPKIHGFGHIHCAYGTKEEDGTLFVNASNLDEGYGYSNEPIKVEYIDGKAKLK